MPVIPPSVAAYSPTPLSSTQDLLVSLHSHASHHLSTTHHLVPPLSPSSPSLPPSALAHFDDLAQRATEQEERLAARGTVAQWKAVRATRIRKAGAGRRRGLWADAERGFEGTALVAMGEPNFLPSFILRRSGADEGCSLPTRTQGCSPSCSCATRPPRQATCPSLLLPPELASLPCTESVPHVACRNHTTRFARDTRLQVWGERR